MALDTRDKRASALGWGLAALLVLPAPDSTVDQGDRQQTAYSYRGIIATTGQTLSASANVVTVSAPTATLSAGAVTLSATAGKVSLTHGHGPDFEFSEVKKLGWLRYDTGRHGVNVREPFLSATVCLDCETGSVPFRIDAKKAIKVLEKWGTDELKARLAIGDAAGSDETRV